MVAKRKGIQKLKELIITNRLENQGEKTQGVKRKSIKLAANKKNSPDKLEITLEENIEKFKEIFIDDETVKIRFFQNQLDKRIHCGILYIDGMVNNEIINENIIQPIVENPILKKDTNTLDELEHQIILSNDVKRSASFLKLTDEILIGNTVLILDGWAEALIMETKGYATRSIGEPDTEKTLRGPREGFTESILTNISMLRRKIAHNDLKFKFKVFGTRTRTRACICYIDGIVNEKILEELYRRLETIDIDGVIGNGYIQELIKDSPLSPLRTIGSTERPDVVAGKLLEGRIALMLDGTPTVLTMPFIFAEYFQSNEDYYTNYVFATLNRILRYIGILVTISMPAVYIALITFHQEMIPTPLLISISAARQGIPFPTIVEILGLGLVFEMLREAGTRMPTFIGQALSIVGALVLGQAAVEARIVSAPVVIIISITGITALMIPRLTGALIVARFSLVFFVSALGLYGYIFGLAGCLFYLCTIRSFGVPYMTALTSTSLQEVKDTFIRAPWWYMKYRPKFVASNKKRQQPGGKKL